MRKNHASKSPMMAGALAGGTLTALALVLITVQPALAALPPRPTIEAPEEIPTVDGGTLVLEVVFPSQWPWDAAPWQEIWTLIQWQDRSGAWHEVAGWQGKLDEVTIADGAVTGEKTWWVGARDLGTEPFRWMVFQRQDGPLLATSEPFELPTLAGQTVEVTLSLAPCMSF